MSMLAKLHQSYASVLPGDAKQRAEACNAAMKRLYGDQPFPVTQGEDFLKFLDDGTIEFWEIPGPVVTTTRPEDVTRKAPGFRAWALEVGITIQSPIEKNDTFTTSMIDLTADQAVALKMRWW